MALLENRYKAAARTEIERDIRRLEERGKSMNIDKMVLYVNGKLDIIKDIELITEAQALEYGKRIQKAEHDRKIIERHETRDIVNDFENPRERATRYQELDRYNAEIRNERDRQSAAPNKIIDKKSMNIERELG